MHRYTADCGSSSLETSSLSAAAIVFFFFFFEIVLLCSSGYPEIQSCVSIQTRLASVSPNAVIKGVLHHTWLEGFF